VIRYRMKFAGSLRGFRILWLSTLALTIVTVSACTSATPQANNSASAPQTPSLDARADAQPTPSAETSVVRSDSFAPLNRAVGFGILRLMDMQERPTARDVVIYRAIPNELPRVGGVITTVPQTPLSHVNLRAVQDKLPNAFIADAATNPEVTALIGSFVRFEVTADGYTLEVTTQAKVDEHFAAIRPRAAQTPQRDLSITEIRSLSGIGFDDWRAFGVKAANLATMGTFGLPDTFVPEGFAIPFEFYVRFMDETKLSTQVDEVIANQADAVSLEEQSAALKRLRDAIKDADVPKWMLDQLSRWQDRYPDQTPLRCRSSTNNEDLPGFSGAGLYDSFTQRPDEGHLAKCIKQVYASLWNDRAFIERDFYRIDHRATAMAVLVHPNFDDEQVNGVAVSADPLYQSTDAYYVNSQRGEELVTNPERAAIPEELLVYADAKPYVVSWSNIVKPGERVLTDEQAAQLRASLNVIHERFAALYQPAAGEQFAMEVEFKITTDGTLAIKQARPWVFSEPLQ
jgi:hypothetical protein